jgi:hypothetical protein
LTMNRAHFMFMALATTWAAAVACQTDRVVGSNDEDAANPIPIPQADASTTSDGSIDAQLQAEQIAGSYSVTLVNGVNGCAFDNIQPGNATPGVPLTITQEPGGQLGRATFGGFPAVFYAFAFGSADYAIRVSGRRLSGLIVGTRSAVRDGCTVTYNATLEASVEGDLIRGRVFFSSVPSGEPSCAKALCTTDQSFSGTLPPSRDY